jgi:hypothetical protein
MSKWLAELEKRQTRDVTKPIRVGVSVSSDYAGATRIDVPRTASAWPSS